MGRRLSEMLDVLVESESSRVQILRDGDGGPCFSWGEGGWTLKTVRWEGYVCERAMMGGGRRGMSGRGALAVLE